MAVLVIVSCSQRRIVLGVLGRNAVLIRGLEQVQRLLASREDIFADYSEQAFERTFSEHFTIEERIAIDESSRALYWMKSR